MSQPDEMSDDIVHDYVLTPDINGAEAAKASGNEFYKSKKFDQALDQYTKAHNLHPTNAIYLGNRSAVYIAKNDYSNALRDSQEATKLDVSYIRGYSRQIKCNIAMGNLGAAKQTCEYVRSSVVFDGEFEDIFKIEISQIKSLENNITQAKLAESQNNYRQAQFYYKAAHNIAVADTNLLIFQIKHTALSSNVTEAHKMIFDVLQKNPQDPTGILIRGICFYLEDSTDKALNHFTRALQLDPGLSEAKHYRKQCKALLAAKKSANEAFSSGKLDDAIEGYGKALLIEPANNAINAKLYYNRALARSKIKQADPDEAEKRDLKVIEDCDSAIKLNSEYAKAYRKRAFAKQNIGEHDEAVRDLETSAKLEPTQENKRLIRDAKQKQKMAERKDYYKILKVTKDADEAQIKKAYRKQALIHHPDRHASSTESEKTQAEKNFKDVNEAFSVLSDPTKKQRFDNGQDIDGNGCGMGGGMGDIDPNIIFQQFFGGGGMGGGSPFGGMGGGSRRGGRGGSRGGGGSEFVFSFG